MKFEAPVAIGRGYYDVGFIGSGTFVNISILHDATTHCVIDAESIGRFCAVSHNVHIGFPEHSTSFLSPHPLFRYDHSSDWCDGWFPKQYDEWENLIGKKNKESYSKKRKLSKIGNDVWIGYDVKILNGIQIGDGAVIAAGSVVTKDVEPYCIVGGIPAKVLKRKFPDNICERLERVKWWEYGPNILHGLAIDDPNRMIGELEDRTIKYPRFISDSIEFHIEENYALHYDADQNIIKKYEFKGD